MKLSEAKITAEEQAQIDAEIAALWASFEGEMRATHDERSSMMLNAARVDGAAFNAYVLRDEEGGGPIGMADMHFDWHELIDTHPRVLIWSHVEAGKSSQISVGRTLFELGRDPSKRIVILSKTQGQAVKTVRSIATYIERSNEVRDVFPHMFPSVPWTSTALMVQREVFSKDFSVQACGVGGAIVGARIDILIIDDILDWANTRTPAQRSELLRWFRSEFVGRLTKNSRVIVCGNAYHPEDFLHMLAKQGYVARTYPVETAEGLPRFPAKWTKQRIAAARIELGPIEAARQLDCVARKDSDVLCKEEWINRCKRNGLGVPLLHEWTPECKTGVGDERFPVGTFTTTGVDLGVGKKKTNAKSVVFTVAHYPDGRRQLIGIESGRWDGTQISTTVLSHHTRYGSIVFIESNGAQMFLVEGTGIAAETQGIISAGVNVYPYNTDGSKSHPVFGVQSIFAEFSAGKWIIPSIDGAEGGAPAAATEPIQEWLAECENFDPNRHTGDHLMAAWIGRQGARIVQSKRQGETGNTDVRVLGDDGPKDDTPVRPSGESRTAAEIARDKAEAAEGWEGLMKPKS